MKIVLLLCLYLISTKAHSQEVKGLSVEAQKFKKYLSGPKNTVTTIRYSVYSKPILVFSSMKDSLILVTLCDYDEKGNLIKKIQLLLFKNQKNPFMYTLPGKSDKSTFDSTIQKILQRLG